MAGNIEEPFPIVMVKSNSFSLNLYPRGWHVYMNIWNPVDREILVCTRETDNLHGNYTVLFICNLCVTGHVPQGLSILFSNFLLLPGFTILLS